MGIKPLVSKVQIEKNVLSVSFDDLLISYQPKGLKSFGSQYNVNRNLFMSSRTLFWYDITKIYLLFSFCRVNKKELIAVDFFNEITQPIVNLNLPQNE